MTSTAEATTLWKVDIHSPGLEVAGHLTDLIQERVRASLGELARGVVRLHVRLYREVGGCTCYIRVDLAPCGGFARGDFGQDEGQAVDRALERIRTAAMEYREVPKPRTGGER